MRQSLRPVAVAATLVLAVTLGGAASPALAQGTTGKATTGAGSSGQMMTKIAVPDVTAILNDAGIRYEVTTDDVGDPLILADGTASLVGERMAVFFYDCGPTGCEDIRMYSYYRSRSNVGLGVINEFNKNLRWGRAFLDDDNDPVFELDINATGGIGREALRILINTYLSSMNTFAAEVDAP
jgi:hypothetical protein